jgi:hypothetical protein
MIVTGELLKWSQKVCALRGRMAIDSDEVNNNRVSPCPMTGMAQLTREMTNDRFWSSTPRSPVSTALSIVEWSNLASRGAKTTVIGIVSCQLLSGIAREADCLLIE